MLKRLQTMLGMPRSCRCRRGAAAVLPLALVLALSACGRAAGVSAQSPPSAAPADAPGATSSSSAAASPPAAGFSVPASFDMGKFTATGKPPLAGPGTPIPVFFLGAQFCPFCAAERWAVARALKQFGTFSTLNEEHSTANGSGTSLPALPTYDLRGAKYDSQYVRLRIMEVADHEGKPLDQPDAEEQQWLNAFNPKGQWPFVMVNGQFTQIGPGYSPQVLAGQQFNDLQAALQDGTSTPATDAINREAATIVRVICAADGGQPADVCGRAFGG